MSKPMLYYIHEQASVMRTLLANREADTAAFVKLMTEKKPDRLYLIGSGTSYNTLYAAKSFLEKYLKMDVFCNVPSSLPVIGGKNPLIILLSQGGNSTNTLAANEKLAAYDRFAVTGDENGRLNDLLPHLVMPIGPEEAGPKTKGYFAGLLFLLLMGLEAGKALGTVSCCEEKAEIASFTAAVDALEANLPKAEAWAEECAATLVEAKHFAAIGKGIGRPAAREGGLKLVETVLIPTTDYEYEEFLHGPDSLICETFGGIYFLPPVSDPDRARVAAVAGFHAKKSAGHVLVVSPDEEVEGALTLPTDGSDLACLFSYVLPCQLLGATVPAKLGIEGVGHKSFEEIDRLVGVKYVKG